ISALPVVFLLSHPFVLPFCPSPTLPFFLSNHPPPPQLSSLPLHDALPICPDMDGLAARHGLQRPAVVRIRTHQADLVVSGYEVRSEEHTSELQSLTNLVCRLLLEKKKNKINFDRTKVNINKHHSNHTTPSL